MISRGIAIVDVHPEHWTNLIRGLFPQEKIENAGWLVLVHHDERVIHSILGGKPLLELIGQRVGDLKSLRHRYRAARVVCLEKDLLRRAHTWGESRLSYDMDYVEQLLTLVAAFRREREAGLRVEPPTPPGPLPPFTWIQFVFNRLWPDDTCVALYVVDEERGGIFTSLILRKRRGDLDLLTTDLHMGAMGLSAMSWRTDRGRVLSSLSEKVAPPYLACFTTLDAWRKWHAAPLGSDVLVSLRREDTLILEPYPRRLAVLATAIRLIARAKRILP
jgi:hypothetical protein